MAACIGIQSSVRRVYSRFYRNKLSADFPIKSSTNTAIKTNQTVGFRSFNSTRDSTNSGFNPWGNCSDGGLGEYTSDNASIASTTDGDVIVRQHDVMFVDTGITLTTSNRCKGLFIYCRGDLILNGNISMTARGAYVDPTVGSGDSGAVSSSGLKFIRAALNPASSAFSVSDLIGCGTPAVRVENGRGVPGELLKAFVTERQGAGGGGGTSNPTNNYGSGSYGGNGGTGVNQTGGGGGGGAWFGGGGYTRWATANSGSGSYGSCFGGGSGGGSAHASNYGNANASSASPWGGPGGSGSGQDGASGGTGNPNGGYTTGGISSPGVQCQNAGTGTGGLLCIFVAGNIVGTGNITADGVSGGPCWGAYGSGSSGGGRVVMLYAGSANNWSGSITATGGKGYASGGIAGGSNGGDGAVNTEKILV